MDALFKPTVLTEAINRLHPVKTTICDRIFAAKKFLVSGAFMWEIRSGSRKTLKNLRPGEAAQITANVGRSVVTCQGTRFSPKRQILASDMADMRKFGEAQATELLADRINTELTDMRYEIDRTREFMAARALAGQVIDQDGTVLVDYGFAQAQKPVLAGKAKWTDSESDPIKNIRAWRKWIAQNIGEVDTFHAFCGSDAMDALLKNTTAVALLKNQAGREIAEEGRVTRLGGVNIEEILGGYVDTNDVFQDFIPATAFVLVGLSPSAAGEIFAPAIDLADPSGVGSGKVAQMFFSKSWEDDDPSARWIKAEARPLPVLYKPECVVYATVV